MAFPYDATHRRRRRRRRVVGGGLVAIIAAALGLWSRRGSSRSETSRSNNEGCASGEERVDGRCVDRRIARGGKVDLNVASADELATIPGIGPELARTIISERSKLGRFESFEQLDKVQGIGPAKLKALQEHAVIR